MANMFIGFEFFADLGLGSQATLPILPYTQEIRGKNRSRQRSSRGEKNVQKNLTCAAAHPRTSLGSLQSFSRPPSSASGEGARNPLPRTPLGLGPAGIGSPFALPWKKSCRCPLHGAFISNILISRPNTNTKTNLNVC